MKILVEIIRARSKTFTLILLLFLADAALYAYVSAYQKPRVASLQQKWFEKRNLASGGKAMSIEEVYRQGTNDLKTFRSRIPPKRDFARVIGELYETAANNSLLIGKVSYKPEVLKGEELLVYTTALDVKGRYAGVKSFLADLQRSREIMAIENLSLNSGSATEESVDVKLHLALYFRTEGE